MLRNKQQYKRSKVLIVSRRWIEQIFFVALGSIINPYLRKPHSQSAASSLAPDQRCVQGRSPATLQFLPVKNLTRVLWLLRNESIWWVIRCGGSLRPRGHTHTLAGKKNWQTLENKMKRRDEKRFTSSLVNVKALSWKWKEDLYLRLQRFIWIILCFCLKVRSCQELWGKK